MAMCTNEKRFSHMKNYAVFGASGFGREVMPVLRNQLEAAGEPHDLVFVDDSPRVDEQNGHRVMSYRDWLESTVGPRYIVIAIANSSVREEISRRCVEDGVEFLRVQAENSIALDDVKIGEGAIICPFVTLTSNVKIGAHFHANIYSYVAHDCIIGDFVTFAPGVKCNGNVVIEDHAYVGTGAIIKQGKRGTPLIIGRGAVVGMGAVVTKNIAPGVTVVGSPAKPLIRS